MAVHLSDHFICFTNTYIQACNCFGAILAITILEPLTTNRYEVKDSYNFATEIIDQDFSNFMGSWDIDLVFTNLPLDENIEICTN